MSQNSAAPDFTHIVGRCWCWYLLLSVTFNYHSLSNHPVLWVSTRPFQLRPNREANTNPKRGPRRPRTTPEKPRISQVGGHGARRVRMRGDTIEASNKKLLGWGGG